MVIAGGLGVAFLTGLAVVLGETAKHESPMLAEANRKKILLVTVGSEPKTLDPNLTDTDPEGKIEEALLEGLIISDPKDGSKQIPGVAEYPNWQRRSGSPQGTFRGVAQAHN
jgi:ABC-type oligopeptide transport system substrate-binding subunit